MTIDNKQNGSRRFGGRLPQLTRTVRARRSRRVAAILAFVALTMLAQAGSINAATQQAARQRLTRSFATLTPLSATGAALAQDTALPGAGTPVPGVVSTPAAPHPVASFKPPITLPTPLPGLPGGPINAPGLYALQATASSVTVTWHDASPNELGFKVFRRDLSGNWQLVDQIATRDVRGTGTNYTWVDTSTDLSGQCYMVAAYNSTSVGDTTEECTVRPDPTRFPQTIPFPVLMWGGLTDVNDGTGSLFNADTFQNLRYAERTFGPNLEWAKTSLWRVEAQGGPHLMKGQAVALKVWGGGWLEYGHETFGVDLKFSSTPVYQWYAIGGASAGSDLNCAACALWNSAAHAFLVPGSQTFGVGLTWASGITPPPAPTPTPTQGVKTEQVFNCATDRQSVEVWIADQTVGGGFVDEGGVDEQYGADGCPAIGSVPLTFSPLSGHQYLLVATDSALPGCGSDDPQDGACDKMTVTFVGDAHGHTRTDTVDGATQITGKRE